MSNPPSLPPTTLPYATPVRLTAPADGIWRSGKMLVVGRAVTLPPVCIRCGEPGAKSYVKTAYWHTPLLYFLIIFPGLLIYAIVALVVRKKATYTCSLCATHAKEQRSALLLVWLGIVLILVAFSFAIAGGNDAFGRANSSLIVTIGISSGIALLLATLIYGIIRLPLLKPKKIDDRYAYYTGAGIPFLEPLSEIT